MGENKMDFSCSEAFVPLAFQSINGPKKDCFDWIFKAIECLNTEAVFVRSKMTVDLK